MIKLLRKYNTWILVIGGALLMIAFLVPQALNSLGQDMSSRRAYTVDGRKVTFMEAQEANMKAAAIRSNFPMIATGMEDRGDHWLLLTETARRSGFIGGKHDGEGLLPQIVDQSLQRELNQIARSDFARYQEIMKDYDKFRQNAIDNLTRSLGAPVGRAGRATMGDALTEARGVRRLIEAYASSPRLSESRLIAETKKLLDEATVSYVFVPISEEKAKALPDPTDAEIITHFDKFKDVLTGGGEYGIGYRQPDRVKIQYLTIDRAVISKLVVVDPVDVQRKLLEKTDDTTTPADTRKQKIEDQLRADLTDKAILAAEQTIKGELLRAAIKLPEQGIFKVLPDAAAWAAAKPDLAKIAESAVATIKRTTGLTVPPFAVTTNDAWLTAKQIKVLPGLGAASVRRGTQTVPFEEAIANLLELKGDAASKARAPMQVGLPFPEPFEDAARNAYYVVVTDARKEASPASVDEVRAEVVLNIKRLKAYDQLKAEGDKFALVASELGAVELISQLKIAGYSPQDPKNNVRVSRGSGANPAEEGVTSKDFTEDVMKHAAELDPTVEFSAANSLARTFPVAAPAKLGVAIVQIVELSPLTLERFRQMAQPAQTHFSQEALKDKPDAPFTVERLIKRLNVEGMDAASASVAD